MLSSYLDTSYLDIVILSGYTTNIRPDPSEVWTQGTPKGRAPSVEEGTRAEAAARRSDRSQGLGTRRERGSFEARARLLRGSSEARARLLRGSSEAPSRLERGSFEARARLLRGSSEAPSRLERGSFEARPYVDPLPELLDGVLKVKYLALDGLVMIKLRVRRAFSHGLLLPPESVELRGQGRGRYTGKERDDKMATVG